LESKQKAGSSWGAGAEEWNSLPVFRYLPAQVKQQVTDYGGSSKEQVQQLVMMQLGLADFPHAEDAADALAVAICHIYQSNFNRRLMASM